MSLSIRKVVFMAGSAICSWVLQCCVAGQKQVAPVQNDGQARPLPLRILVALDKPTYLFGEAVTMHVVVTNWTDAGASIVEVGDDRDFRINLTDDRGDAVPLTDYGRNLVDAGGFMRLLLEIPPHYSKEYTIRLTELFQITKPGRYGLVVRKACWCARNSGTNWADIVSNEIGFSIKAGR